LDEFSELQDITGFCGGFVGENALALPPFGHLSQIADRTSDYAGGESAERRIAGDSRVVRNRGLIARPGAEKREG